MSSPQQPTPSVTTLTVPEWENKYSPISFDSFSAKYPDLCNPRVDRGDHGDAIFETWGDEKARLSKALELIATDPSTSEQHVWTLADTEDGGIGYFNGYHEDPIYYVISEKSWKDKDEVPADIVVLVEKD